MKLFTLQPFANPNNCRDFSLTGQVSCKNSSYRIHYELTGPLAFLHIPSPAAKKNYCHNRAYCPTRGDSIYRRANT